MTQMPLALWFFLTIAATIGGLALVGYLVGAWDMPS
jgi:hypothetical protein